MPRWTIHQRGPTKGRLAAVTVEHDLYCFGGGKANSDGVKVHVFNTVSLRWTKSPLVTTGRGNLPSWRQGHTAVLIEDIYIWGGSSDCNCNLLYAFDVVSHGWFEPEVSRTAPEARKNHSACVLRKAMYIYGGSVKTMRCADGKVYNYSSISVFLY